MGWDEEIAMATDIRLKEGLPEVTAALVNTYVDCGKLSHLGHKPLPSRAAVVDILADLYELLYPGFGRRQNLHLGNIEYFAGELIDGLHDKLTHQIAAALRHELCQEAPHVDFEALGQQKAISLLQKLPDIRSVLEQDVEAAYAGDPAAKSYTEIIFCYPGLEAITPRPASTSTPARRSAPASSSTTAPAWSSARRARSAPTSSCTRA